MKNTLIALSLAGLLFASCGSNENKSENEETAPPVSMVPETINTADMSSSTGVGPINSMDLGELDESLAIQGKEVFDAKCTACHKVDAKFIGPSPKGILDRRKPEWVMNMILNPEGMVAEDPVAKQLLIEFNGAPMANQNLTEDEARSVLEYFRTL